MKKVKKRRFKKFNWQVMECELGSPRGHIPIGSKEIKVQKQQVILAWL